MAWKMSYTVNNNDGTEIVCPDSFWFLQGFDSNCRRSKRAVVYFMGYKDKASFLEGKDPIPNAVKKYFLEGDVYDSVLCANSIVEDGTNLYKNIYEYAKTILDVSVDGVDKSFFDGAEKISVS